MQQTVRIQPARISSKHRRRVRGQSAAGADDDTEQKDPSSQELHNERVRGVRHEDVASLVPACSGARVCHEQCREDSVGSTDRSINSAELVERCPLTTRRLVKRMQRRLQESEVAHVRHDRDPCVDSDAARIQKIVH